MAVQINYSHSWNARNFSFKENKQKVEQKLFAQIVCRLTFCWKLFDWTNFEEVLELLKIMKL